jgi:putative transposase
MLKAIKVRLYPNHDQEELLMKNCGSARFVYNYFLARKVEEYKATGNSISNHELSAELTELKHTSDFEWLQEVDSQSLQQALINLDQAYKNFFRRVKLCGPVGFPKFKSRGVRDSFRLTQSLSVDENYLRCGKHGWIKFRGNQDLVNNVEKIKSITVSLDAGHWYASCLIEIEEQTNHIHQHHACGIDIGVVRPLTIVYETIDGEVKTKVLGRKFSTALAVKENRRKRYQRQLARKQKGSANRQKALLKVQKAYFRERQLRKDWVEKTSNQLASRFELVVFEDLKVQRMTEKGSGKTKLNESMRRLGLSNLVSRTEQKSLERQGSVIYIDPAYTSQTCNACGSISKQNRKSQAVFKCVSCGHADNADRNAGLNILDTGLLAA